MKSIPCPQPPSAAAEPHRIESQAAGATLPAAATEAGRWLETELLAERAAINELVEKRHRDILLRFRLHLKLHPPKPLEQAPAAEGVERCVGRVAKCALEGPPVRPSRRISGRLPTWKAAEAEAFAGGTTIFKSEGPAAPAGVQLEVYQRDESMRSSCSSQTTSALEERGRLAVLVTSARCEILFGVLIIANAVVMAVQRQYEGDHTADLLGYRGSESSSDAWPDLDLAFVVLEWVFGCLFVLEVLVKMIALHARFFTETLWNVFDLVVVSAWLFDRITLSTAVDPTVLRISRLLRLTRLLRVLRWLQVFDTLILMVKAIKASMSVLCCSLLLMMLLISVIAMVISASVEPFVQNERFPLTARAEVFESWGTFTRAVETVFEITLGNFGPPTRLLMNEVTEWWAFFILSYKVTIGFAVVQVIMSVFIQQTFKVASRDEEVMIKEKTTAAESYSKHLRALFQHLDTSGDGMISKEEFKEMAATKDVKAWFSALEVEASDVAKLFDLLDNGNGEITQEEFLKGVQSLKGGAKGSDMLVLTRDMKQNLRLITALDDKVRLMAQKLML